MYFPIKQGFISFLNIYGIIYFTTKTFVWCENEIKYLPKPSLHFFAADRSG